MASYECMAAASVDVWYPVLAPWSFKSVNLPLARMQSETLFLANRDEDLQRDIREASKRASACETGAQPEWEEAVTATTSAVAAPQAMEVGAMEVNDPPADSTSAKNPYSSQQQLVRRIKEDSTMAGKNASVSLECALEDIFSRKEYEKYNLGAMAEIIQTEMNNKNWNRIFIKLTTRSPKDSELITHKAEADYRKVYNGMNTYPDILPSTSSGNPRFVHEAAEAERQDANDRMIWYWETKQRNFGVSSGAEAMARLVTSDRVSEDCEAALKETSYDQTFGLSLREYTTALPIQSEFRCIAYNGKLTAIAQYYHLLKFQDFQPKVLGQGVPSFLSNGGHGEDEIISNPDNDKVQEIKKAIGEFYTTNLSAGLRTVGLATCTIDFAYVNGQVMPIEVNPFDPDQGVGNNPASLGIFDWETDQEILKGEARDSDYPVIRVRTKARGDLKVKSAEKVRNFVFGTREAKLRLKEQFGKGKGATKGAGKTKELPDLLVGTCGRGKNGVFEKCAERKDGNS